MKESVAYQAVASNTSGSTPKDLYEDVVEELDKNVFISNYSQHHLFRLCRCLN